MRCKNPLGCWTIYEMVMEHVYQSGPAKLPNLYTHPCSTTGCGGTARGSGVCVACLEREMERRKNKKEAPYGNE